MRLAWVCFAVISVAILSGCGAKPAAPSSAAPRMTNTGAAPTQAECEELGRKLEKALLEGDQEFANQFFRFPDLMQRTFSDIDMPSRDRQQFNQQMPAMLGPAMQKFHEQLKSAKVKFLRVKVVDGQPRVVLRLVMEGEGEGVNYHEYPIVRYPDGKLGAEDMYVIGTGEMITTTLRRIIVPMISQANQGLLDRLSGGEQLYAKNMQNIVAITSNLRSGNHAAALAAFDRLPAELQKDKSLLLISIQCASASEPRYLELLEKYRALFPNDAAIDLISIDYFLMKQKFDEAQQSIDRTMKTIGEDAYLHVLKGNVYMEANQFEKAREQVELAIKMEDDLQDAYWARVTIGLREQKYADVSAWMKKLVEKFNETLAVEELAKTEVFAGFGKSSEFVEFKKWYNDRQKTKE